MTNLDLAKNIVANVILNTEKGNLSDSQITKDVAEAITKATDEAVLNMHSDIAHAIGYCRGLGYPDDYLEARYPGLTSQQGGKNES